MPSSHLPVVATKRNLALSLPTSALSADREFTCAEISRPQRISPSTERTAALPIAGQYSQWAESNIRQKKQEAKPRLPRDRSPLTCLTFAQPR